MGVREFVFACEMEHVDWLPSVLEVCITNGSLVPVQLTVIVKDEIFWC